jgi:hypothetical protein
MPSHAVPSRPAEPIFELAEMAKVVGMPFSKAKNWTMGRPIRFRASLRSGMGTGSRNLYSLDDVYLVAIAHECSKTGMAAKAIGKLIDAVRMKLPAGLHGVGMLYAWRGPKLTYRIEAREDRLSADTVVRLVINVRALRATVDLGVRKLRKQ